jgi:hypothetical protein
MKNLEAIMKVLLATRTDYLPISRTPNTNCGRQRKLLLPYSMLTKSSPGDLRMINLRERASFSRHLKAVVRILGAMLSLGLGQLAFADELVLMSGGLTGAITDNGSCAGSGCGSLSGDQNSVAGTVAVSGSINGWEVDLTGINAGNGGIYLESSGPIPMSVQCISAGGCTGANSLQVLYSATNFDQALYSATGLSNGYADTLYNAYDASIGPSGGVTSEALYLDPSDVLLAETTLLGSIGPFSYPPLDPFGFNVIDPSLIPPGIESETIDLSFSANDGTSFQAIADSWSVPEPTSMILMFTMLFGVAFLARRRIARA